MGSKMYRQQERQIMWRNSKRKKVKYPKKVNISHKSFSEEPFEDQNRKCNLTVYMNMFLTFGGKLR